MIQAIFDPIRTGARAARKELARFRREEPGHAIGLAALMLVALGLGLASLDQPVRCDEARTFVEFVLHSFAKIASDYSSTNNHIFHNLLSKVAAKLFGVELWAMRLPTLAAGVLLVPTAYVAFRIHFDRTSALVACAWIATNPQLVDQATNARGYTIITVIFMALLALAPTVVERRSRAAWAAFVVLAALGVYTSTVMVVPLGIVLVWMAISGLIEIPRSDWPRFAGQTALALAVTGLAVGILYAPTLLGPDKEVIFVQDGEVGITLGEASSLADLPLKTARALGIVWRFWMLGIPAVLASATLALVAASFLAGRGRSAGARLIGASLLALALITLGARRPPPLWSFSYLAPVYLGCAAAGIVWLMRKLTRGDGKPFAIVAGLAALVLCFGSGAISIRELQRPWGLPWYVGFYDAPAVAKWVDANLSDEERIVGLGRHLATIRYYEERAGSKRPINFGKVSEEEAKRFYVIVAGEYKSERLLKIVERAGLEPTGFVKQFEHSEIRGYERKGPTGE